MKKQKRRKQLKVIVKRALKRHSIPTCFAGGMFGISIFAGLSFPIALGIAFASFFIVRSADSFAHEVIDELDLDDLIEDMKDIAHFKIQSKVGSSHSEDTSRFAKLLRSRDRAVRETAKRTQRQVEQTETMLGRIELLLLAKLSPTELTFNRYKQSSENVANGILTNVDLLLEKITTLEELDYVETSSRLSKLEKWKSKKDSNQTEIDALTNKKQGMLDLSRNIRDILSQNVEALGKLDDLALALANLNISEGREASDLNRSMQDLDTLIGQVDLYDSTSASKKSSQQEKEKIKI